MRASRTLLVVVIYILAMFAWVLIAQDAASQAPSSMDDAPDAAPYVGLLKISKDTNPDRRLYIFTITTHDGALTVMGDQHLEIVQWLLAHDKQRVPVTLGTK
jgi:hypothetical protein